MTDVYLIGREWKMRALVRAQLIEEGVEVEAFETVREAFQRLEEGPVLPRLVVADLASSDNPAADAVRLGNWTNQTPIWVIASHTWELETRLKEHGFEMVLFRPLRLDELVGQVKQRIARP